ncbi:MAG: glycosyltransferase family 2 protein [Aquabacterium sp.]|nr:MAG: glycosyltransferase family 2 protein [Aquabacterium sp.]
MSARLALVMIARDEARCIERCLRSAAPWVDEMLVVDTGSKDATPALAAAAGARVLHFDWIDDFSAARNFALSQTDADWRLVLDADEWLEGGMRELQELLAARSAGFVGQVEVRSDFDDAGQVRQASSWISRLLPRGVHYAGRVHEQPVHRLPVQRLALRIGHDGYRSARQQAKGDRNERLLQAALRERPDHPYLLYQLGKEAEIRDDFHAAATRFKRAHAVLRGADALVGARINGTAAERPEREPGWLHDLVVRLIFSLKRDGEHAQAVQLAEREMAHWAQSPDFYFALGDLLLDWAASQPQRAGELLPMIEAAWLRCLEIGERPELEGAVAGRGSTLAAHNLALLYDSLGQGDKASAYRRMT